MAAARGPRIGVRAEAGYGAQARARAAELAMHFTRGQDPHRAVQYLQYAGENALWRAAFPEAMGHLTTGLEVLQTLPDTPARMQQELHLLLLLAEAVNRAKGQASADFEHLYVQAQALCQRLGDTPRLVMVLHGLRQVYNARGDFPRARAYGEQALALAQRLQDPALLAEAHYALGAPAYNQGACTEAQAHFVQSIRFGAALAEPRRSRREVLCRTFVAGTLWMLGYPAQALQQSQEALALAQSSDPYSVYYALEMAGQLHQLRGEVHAAHAQFEAALALATEQQLAEWRPITLTAWGWALAAQGQHAEGIAQMRQGLAALQALGFKRSLPRLLAGLAEAYGHSGQVEEGLRCLAEARAVQDDMGGYRYEAEVYRLQGALLLRQAISDAPQAEACFQQALAVARRQQAKSWELRAAMSLARLWQRQGKRAAARELLAPIYGWFTEGFDTADLQDAGALLDARQ